MEKTKNSEITLDQKNDHPILAIMGGIILIDILIYLSTIYPIIFTIFSIVYVSMMIIGVLVSGRQSDMAASLYM